jgi:hypothetical protein
MANVKNYHEQGGEKWVVGGELELVEEGRLLFNGQEVKPAKGLTDSEAATIPLLKGDFNNLLEKLYLAGLMVADKSDLENAILATMVILEDAEVGDWHGAFPQAACDTFNTAIETAQDIFHSTGVTQTGVNTASTTLATAASAFEGAVVVVDKSALVSTLTSALGILASAEVGDWDGAYRQEDFDTYSAAIAAAQAVADDGKASQTEVNAAKTALEEAVTTFQDAAIVVDKTELEAAITAAQTLLSGATVGSGQGEYPQAAYDIFSAAITEAQTVANDDKATQDEVDGAKTTLGEAVTAFEAAVIE